MPRFVLTYAAMDHTIANPFWHALILLSKENETTGELKVVDQWTYYPMRSTDKNSFSYQVKSWIGLKVDLNGNHGFVCHEKLSDLNLVDGLRGKTYEVTEEQFNRIQQRCQAMSAQQDQAIEEHVKALDLKPTEGFYHYYPYEKDSRQIYEAELKKSATEGKPPRLNPFTFGLTDSYTCKNQVLALLKDVLSQKEIDELIGWSKPFPRWGANLERISVHTSDVAETKESKSEPLHWSLPPQLYKPLPGNTPFFSKKISADTSDEILKAIRQLVRLEQLFLTAEIDQKYASQRKALIDTIKMHNNVFATARVANKVLDNLCDAKALIDNLYNAVVDDWEDHDEIETVAIHLNREDQETLCNIVGRRFVKSKDNYLNDDESTLRLQMV